MPPVPAVFDELPPRTSDFYVNVLAVLAEAKVPYLLGGAYALSHYTGISRHTKDMDLFVRPSDVDSALEVLGRAGYRTEIIFSHWLGKAYSGDDFIDVIFCSGNGLCCVDDDWFAHAVPLQADGPALLCPPEELIWQKAFIMERERFDGADVAHLIRACGASLNWDRLLRRFGPYWQLLLSHLLLFSFVYPGERDKVPDRVLRELMERWRSEMPSEGSDEKICRGPLLSRMQYLADTERWGYRDPRLRPHGDMTAEQITHWTAAGR